MGGRETHFELFLRKTPKAGWALVDATPNRAAAIEKGKKLLASNPQGGVRVVKEERSGKEMQGAIIRPLLFARGK